MNVPTHKYFRVFLTFVFCFATSIIAQTNNKFPYNKEDMPFNAPPVERPTDKICSDEGSASNDPQKAQNRAKNNFGVNAQSIPVQIADFDRLEKASLAARNCWFNGKDCRKLELNNRMLPVDRSQLANMATTADGASIGEGTLVTLTAKVRDSHYSNTKYNIYGKDANGKPETGSGESVNCSRSSDSERSEIDRNDIHIVLVAPGVTDECLSVTAEISPHYRPDSWRRFHNMKKNAVGDINLDAKGVNFKKIQQVRITGPLFYDASHEPCSPNKRASPARRSIWEIHPVYKLDVQVSGNWMSFDEWAKTQ